RCSARGDSAPLRVTGPPSGALSFRARLVSPRQRLAEHRTPNTEDLGNATMNAQRSYKRMMVAAAWACVVLGLQGPARAQERSERPALGTIERLDPRFDRLVPADARVERIADGFDWAEGPVWDRKQRRLLFSDVPMNTVFQWQDGKGVSVFLKPSGYT